MPDSPTGDKCLWRASLHCKNPQQSLPPGTPSEDTPLHSSVTTYSTLSLPGELAQGGSCNKCCMKLLCLSCSYWRCTFPCTEPRNKRGFAGCHTAAHFPMYTWGSRDTEGQRPCQGHTASWWPSQDEKPDGRKRGVFKVKLLGS